MKIGFIGSGKMAEALMKSFLDAELVKVKNLYASDVKKERLSELKDRLKVNLALSNKGILKNCDVVFLSVKPQNMEEVLNDIGEKAEKRHLIISIAAGVNLEKLEKALQKARVVRVMPNTPCLAGEGMSAFCLGKNANEDDRETVNKLMSSCGKCIEVKEEMMDAITALSGSGPAFFALLLQYFAEAGARHGLKEEGAALLAKQTFYGTGKLLAGEDLQPEKLIEMVASKGGTTEAGLEVLQQSDVREVIMRTVEAAVKRSKQLGGRIK